ncbi:MAG: lipid-A-disaccharide synthase, partial [Desulfosarcinaceae bacterium]
MRRTAERTIVMIAGEASGDLHGAKVVQQLKQQLGDIAIHAVGGGAMARAGARIIVDNRDLAVVGVSEALAKAPHILRTLSRLKHFLQDLRPDLLILIDFPDFNLHLAAYAKKLKIPVLYYISPQIWAWRPGRVK